LELNVTNIFRIDEYIIVIFQPEIYVLCLFDDQKSFKNIIPIKNTEISYNLKVSHDDKKIFFYNYNYSYFYKKGINMILCYMSNPKYIKFKYLNKQEQTILVTLALICKKRGVPRDILKLILIIFYN